MKRVIGKCTSLLSVLMILGFLCQPVMAGDVVVNGGGGQWGDALKKCMWQPFEKATGNRVIVEPDVNFAKQRAMVLSGNVQWDICEVSNADLLIIGAKEGLFEPLDYTIISKKDAIEGSMEPYYVVSSFYTTVLAYDAKKYPEGKEPKSWKDFWDVEKFPGVRSLRNSPYNNLEFALMADGVPPDKLYPLDVDRAFRSLDKIKPYVKVWWQAGAQPIQLLVDREADMVSAWYGRIIDIQKQGAKVGFTWNQGHFMYGGWVVLKGAPHKKIAMELLNFYAHPKNQACLASTIPYPGGSMKIFDYVSPEVARNLCTYPENFKKQVGANTEWWVENRKKLEDRWNTWLLKK